MDALFAQQRQWVDIEVMDKAKGEFILYFNPLKADKTKKQPQGWDHEHLLHSLRDPAPKGLGLAVSLMTEKP